MTVRFGAVVAEAPQHVDADFLGLRIGRVQLEQFEQLGDQVDAAPLDFDEPGLVVDPGADYVRGWTADGRRVLFASTRATVPTPGAYSSFRPWTVSVDGGMPYAIPLPRAFTGNYSVDQQLMVYHTLSRGLIPAPWL